MGEEETELVPRTHLMPASASPEAAGSEQGPEEPQHLHWECATQNLLVTHVVGVKPRLSFQKCVPLINSQQSKPHPEPLPAAGLGEHSQLWLSAVTAPRGLKAGIWEPHSLWRGDAMEQGGFLGFSTKSWWQWHSCPHEQHPGARCKQQTQLLPYSSHTSSWRICSGI